MQETSLPVVKPLIIREGAEIPSRTIGKIAQDISQKTKASTEWDNGYTDYNERWIDRPAWSEHIDRGWSDRGGPPHTDHARTWK